MPRQLMPMANEREPFARKIVRHDFRERPKLAKALSLMADSTMILFAGGITVVTIYTLSWCLDWAINEHTYLNAGKTLCAAPYSPTRLEICSSRSRMDPYCMERGKTDIERAFEFKASICPQPRPRYMTLGKELEPELPMPRMLPTSDEIALMELEARLNYSN